MIDKLFAWLLSLSRGQLLTLVLCITAFLVVICVVKKVIKIILVLALVAVALVYFGVYTPEELKKSAEVLADSVTSQEVVSLSVVSDKVRITDGIIEFNIGGSWYCVDDVTRLRLNSDGVYMLEVDDSELSVSDPDVQKLLDTLTTGN